MSTTSPPPPADAVEPAPAAGPAPGAAPAGNVVPGAVVDHEAPVEEAGRQADPAPEEPSLGTPGSWRETLLAAGLPDTLLAVADPGDQALDLTHAHPSGLATLLAGRPTPLSMLFREAAVHSAARRRSRSLRAVAGELAADRGVRAGLLTAGVARWTAPWAVDPGEDEERVHAPVLLRGCDVRPRGAGHDDYELELDESAVVNPELLRRLREDHGVRLDGEALAELAFGIHGFDPDPVFRVLEGACAGVPGFVVEPRVLVGCFTAGSDALLADLDAALPALAGHPLLGRLADPLLGVVAPPVPARAPDGTSPAVLDLDPEQRRVLAAALAGQDVAVEGPPGTGLTHTLAACVAGLAEQGRRVLVLTPYRGTADALTERLDAAGLGDLVLSLHDGTGDRPRLLAALGSALDAAVSDRPPEAPTALFAKVDETDDDVDGDAAEELEADLTALHTVREPWRVSAYDAMVELAALMAAPAPPRTRVRLGYDVCRRLDAAEREELRTALREAAELGAFTLTPEQAPWLDAHVGDEAEARQALAAARSGRASLEVARQSMARIAAAAGLVEAASVDGWHRQLDLLVGVRDTLDVLLPTVFEQPLGELIAATAPEGGPPGSSFMARRALRRRARSLVRPGVHLPDLHVRLLMAQRQLAGWQARSSGGGWPRVPTGLAVAEQALDALEHALDVLGVALPRTGPEELRALPLEVLDDRLAALAGDGEGAADAPRRARLLARLRDAGLGDLLDDLRSRAAGRDDVDGELDLAWWTSVLEAVIRSDARLARHEPDTLTGLVDRLREEHTRATAAARRRVRLAVEERARQVAAEHPEQARWLLSEVHRGHRSRWPNDLVRHAPDLLAALRPVWVLSPDAAARLLPPAASGHVVDVVVVDDAGQVGFPEAAAALVRGRQVIVAGDGHRLPPATGGPSVLEVVASLTGVRTLKRDHRCRDGRLLAPLLNRYDGWTATPGAAARSPLVVEHVREGTGVAAPGEEVAVSPDAEVLRVVDLVTEHAVRRPGESLLVVTLGLRHAARIEEALRAEVAHNPDLARWLDVHWTGGISEPFLVRPVHRLAGLERDAVIVSIGLARTPHGRVLHRFGVLDGRHGVACLVAALSRARRRTTVACAFRAEDISAERVRSEGARLLRDLLEVATDPGLRGDHDARLALAPEPAGPTGPDHLVADLARRLREAGLPVATSLPAPDRPLDLAVGDGADPGRMLLAVDVDVPAHAGLNPADVRERQRRAAFERSGWRYLRVAAMDLFCDPEREVARIRQAWRAAGGAPAAVTPVAGVPHQPRNRAPWPDVTPGRAIGAYGERELDAVARWVLSDGVPRTPDALAAELRDALQIDQHGERAEATMAAAARRVLGAATLVS
ncbi:MAG TPA: AAA family ATPase [Kineosporiaceae bacterium]|nr:AAA family ATPase [Kineosporiaceae bacterium]